MTTTKKLEKLTPQQEAKLITYREEGIRLGLATSPDLDEALVKELTQSHREICGVKPATNFLVFDSPFAASKQIPECKPSNALFGHHDAHWLSFYQFFKKECSIKNLEKTDYLFELCKHVGWMWMSSDTTVVTRRPEEIHLLSKPNSRGGTLKVLHNYHGMALRYRDGTGVYSINGTRIPKEYHHLAALPRDSVPVEEVMGISNTEIRTEFLKKIGIEKAFDKLGKKKLDTQTMEKGGTYELFSVEMGDTTRVYLRGTCPSNEESFFEAVPPDCKTVGQALSFRNFGTIKIPFTGPEVLT